MNFKVGDTVKKTKDKCCDAKEGNQYEVKKCEREDCGEDSRGLIIASTDHDDGCHCTSEWQLIKREEDAEKYRGFKIGEKVTLKDYTNSSYSAHKGEEAEITEFDKDEGEDYNIQVEWEDGEEIWVEEDNLIKINGNKDMTKLTQVQKSNMSEDAQTLFKAGFIGADMELTDVGKEALMALEFEANKEALVKSADALIKEEDKSSK